MQNQLRLRNEVGKKLDGLLCRKYRDVYVQRLALGVIIPLHYAINTPERKPSLAEHSNVSAFLGEAN